MDSDLFILHYKGCCCTRKYLKLKETLVMGGCHWLWSLVVCSVVFVGSIQSLEIEERRHKSIHDEIAVEVKRAPPIEEEQDLLQPTSHIRIHVHPDNSLLNNEDLSYLYHDKSNSALWRAVETFGKGLLVRPLLEPATIEPSCEFFSKGSNQGYCKNGTSEQKCGIFSYPDELAGDVYVCDSEEGLCGYVGDAGEGIEADYIVIVGAEDALECDSDVLVFASYCNVEYDHKRPVNGYINLCPSYIDTISHIDDIMYSTILQQMAHLLGFSSRLYPYYGDKSPVSNQTYGGLPIYALTTPSITQEVHNHFNCSTVDYAPLENFGELQTAGSHWEARMFNHELMQQFMTYDYTVISNFTWGFFHDSNWYDVDYAFVKSYALDNYEFKWGKDEGCGIIIGDCDDSDVYGYNCPVLNTESCTPERLGMGSCLSSPAFDLCQVVTSTIQGTCLFDINYNNETDDLFYLAQKYGEQSRCFQVWDLEECQYSPGCYGTRIYKYQPTNEFSYKIIGQEAYTDGPVWCYEGRHVEVGVDYVLCPPVSEIMLHASVQDIIDVNDEVPPPLCHESCLTCTVPHDSSSCLSCYSGYMLEGDSNMCNGTAEVLDPTKECGDKPTPPDTGCTALFGDKCCTGGNCKTPEGCYCDQNCHTNDDCCSDIEETCPLKQTTTTHTTTTTTKKSSTTKVPTSTATKVTSTPPVITSTTSEVITKVTTTTTVITSTSEVISTTSSKAIPQVTTTSEAIPQATTTSKAIPQVTTTSEAVPQVTTTREEIPEIPSSSEDLIPEITSTIEVIPTTTSEVIPPVTATSEAIPSVTTTPVIASSSEVIPEITSTSEVIPPVTTTSEAIPSVTTTPVIASSREVIPEITSTSDVIPEVTTEIVPTTTSKIIATTTSSVTTPIPSTTPTPTVCQDNEARVDNDYVVQWCQNGTWESVCYSSSWDYKNAIVLCNEQSLPSSGAYVDQMPASEDTVFSHVQEIDCAGSEDSLNECSYSEQEGVCESNQVIHAYCIQGLGDCAQCNKLVECAVEGITRDTYSELTGSILACTVQFSDPEISTSAFDEFFEIRFLTGLSTSLVKQFGVISREQTRAIQEQCQVSGQYPQHGDPIVTLQEMGIETLRILYEDADGSASVRDFTHSDIRNSISRNDFTDLFKHDQSIGCSFQHLLYWLARVPTLAPAYCRDEEGRSTLIDTLIHCNSPFQQCLDAAESEGFEPGSYYPIIGENDIVEVQQCSENEG